MEIAQNQSFVVNEKANPDIGQAYAIIRNIPVIQDQTPYHIAMVVAKDDGQNITLEADVGDENRNEPVFDIYATTKTQSRTKLNTFHQRYKSTYGEGVNTATGILKRRNSIDFSSGF